MRRPWVLGSVTPVRTDGEIESFFVQVADITERKPAELTLLDANGKLEVVLFDES